MIKKIKKIIKTVKKYFWLIVAFVVTILGGIFYFIIKGRKSKDYITITPKEQIKKNKEIIKENEKIINDNNKYLNNNNQYKL